jgi:hypothetical protein
MRGPGDGGQHGGGGGELADRVRGRWICGVLTGRTGSRAPFQILAGYYQTGDTRDRDLWREYGRVTRSLAAVRWSRGLRAIMLGPAAAPERTDEELAGEDIHGELLIDIPITVWSIIRLARAHGYSRGRN